MKFAAVFPMTLLSTIHLYLVHFILGPYTTHIDEPNGARRVSLLSIHGKEFELQIFYEINTYSKVYHRWWVPTHQQHVIKLSAEITGNPPDRLKSICEHYLHLPYNGPPHKPSSLELYDASNLFLDSLTNRGLGLRD